MRLEIEKLPPIVEPCSIDLDKKLLVFVGRNNAGKTYVSKLIWGIYDLFTEHKLYYASLNAIADEEEEEKEKRERKERDRVIRRVIKEISRNIIGPSISEIIIKWSKFKKLIEISIDRELGDILSTTLTFLPTIPKYRILLTKQDLVNLKMDASFYIFFHKNSEDITITLDEPSELSKTIKDYKSKEKNSVKVKVFTSVGDPNLHVKFEPYIPREQAENALYAVFVLFWIKIFEMFDSFSSPIYLPESRLVFPKFYKYLLNSQRKKIREMMRWGIVGENLIPFEGSIVEEMLMEQLIMELEMEVKDKTYLRKLQQILEGEIEVHQPEGIGLSQFAYHQSGIKFPMEQSSSMVNQLALLYIYFKYWWERYPFLIIDEPEMNLHPAKQVELTRFLLEYASKNKVLMTTHSPTIAKTIINYIELLNLKEEKPEAYYRLLQEWGWEDLELKSDEIGIYYFNGRTVVPYKEGGEGGIHFGTFTEVEKGLEELYWAIDDAREEE